jgi:hypothetical protein
MSLLLHTFTALALVLAARPAAAEDAPPLTVDVRTDRPIVHVDPRDQMAPLGGTPARRAYIRVRIESARNQPPAATPLNLAVVIDRIPQPGGDDDALANAVRALVGDLTPNDLAAVVGYSDVVEVLWPSGPPRDDLDFLGRLVAPLPQAPALPGAQPTPRANVFGGIAKGAAEVRRFVGPGRVSHIIVLASHAPGLGPQRPAELAQLGQALARDGIGLTIIDTGARPDRALRALADGATGAHHNAQDAPRIRTAMADTVARLRAIRARDVRLDITFHEGVVPVRVISSPGAVMRGEVNATLGDLRPPGAFEVIAQLDTARCPVGTRIIADAGVRYFDMQLLREHALHTPLTVTCSPGEPHEAHFDYDVLSSVALALGEDARERSRAAAARADVETARTLLAQTIDELRETANAIKHPEILTLIDELEAELRSLGNPAAND